MWTLAHTEAVLQLARVKLKPEVVFIGAGFIGFIVLNAGVNRPAEEVESEVVKLVREEIGPVAAFKTVMTVKRLPKTRSGKILRGTMRQIADGEPWKMPATIDDPAILEEITGVMTARGMVRPIDEGAT